MGAEYLSYVKSIVTFAPTFYGYIISALASVNIHLLVETIWKWASESFAINVINICITLKNLLIIYYQQNRLENKSYDNKNFVIAAFNK